jgi:3-oxoacyl-[acyl-carrier-protein] synthase-3
VQDRLGAKNAGASDISAACAGFPYGLGLANGLISAGESDYVLVIGVEKLSDWTDMTDRGTAFIFADGAGAFLMGPAENPGIGPTIWGADGSEFDAIVMEPNMIELRDHFQKTGEFDFPKLRMQGQKVFKWAVGSMVDVCYRALDAAGLTPADIQAFIPHQANNRITDALVRGLKFPESVVVARDIIMTGNTSAASIPLALDTLLRDGQVKSGDLALTVGFGAGLAYAAQVIRIP